MSSRIVCNLCSTSFATEKQYKRHLKTKKHINNVEKLDKISQNIDLNNPEDEKDVYVYTTRDFEEATNAYEKVIKELNMELESLKYQLESSKSEKLSIHLALKNAEDQLDSNYREINQMNDNLEKNRIDLGNMMDKNIQLERRIQERVCCFSFI